MHAAPDREDCIKWSLPKALRTQIGHDNRVLNLFQSTRMGLGAFLRGSLYPVKCLPSSGLLMTWARPSSGNPGSAGGGITSVNGQTGPAVVLTAGDVGAAPTDSTWSSAPLTLTAYPPAVLHDPGMAQSGDDYRATGNGLSLGGVWLASGPPGASHDLEIDSPPTGGGEVCIVIAYPTSSGEYGYCAFGIADVGGTYWTCIPTIVWDPFRGYTGLSALMDVLPACPTGVRWDHGTNTIWLRDSLGVWAKYSNALLNTLLPRTLATTGPPEAVGLGLFQDLNLDPVITVTARIIAGVAGAPGSVGVSSLGNLLKLPTPASSDYPWALPAQASGGANFNMPLGVVGQQSLRAQTVFDGQTAIGLTNLTSDGQMEYFLFGGRYILPAGTARGQVLRMTPWPLGILQSWQTEGYTHDMWREGAASGRWYPVPFSAGGATAMSTAAIPTNTMRAFPLVVGHYHTIESVAINVTTAAGVGSEARMGLYYDDNGYPAALEADFGAVSTASLGVKSITGFAPVLLTPGTRYWFVLWGVGAPTCRAQPLGNLAPVLGTDMSTTFGVGWSMANVYTAGVSTMPLTFPAGGTILTVSSPTPFIQLGV